LGRQRNRVALVGVFLAACLVAGGCGEEGRRTLTLGVPTTVQDSGLLDALLPEFERAYPGYRLKYVAAGSGELLALAARGDVDVLLGHSPSAEVRFMEAGHGVSRHRVMENDFVIVGAPSDPAGIIGLHDAAAALTRIRDAGAPFVSRGDDSGTHRKEIELREAAGSTAGGPGYRESGLGMGAVLRAASELGAYTLSDRATFVNLENTLDLEVMVESDARLVNVYHVIVVKGAREPEAAQAFAEWLISEAGRRVIGTYGEEQFGRSLFRPAEPTS
jgi:tungstate transport system substrate-binding protein